MGNCIKKEPISTYNPNHQPLTKSPSFSLRDLAVKCDAFSLTGQVHLGYCIDVYDGDTCTINLRSDGKNHQWKVRLLGFDAAELKTIDKEEKTHGLACREMLKELIYEKYVVVKCSNFEKYGRLLGTVLVRATCNDEKTLTTESCEVCDLQQPETLLNVNGWMLQHTPCVPYDGGTKAKVTYDGIYHPNYLAHLNHCKSTNITSTKRKKPQ
jgi:hypothetical protein